MTLATSWCDPVHIFPNIFKKAGHNKKILKKYKFFHYKIKNILGNIFKKAGHNKKNLKKIEYFSL